MRRNLIWASLFALSLLMATDAKADIVEFDFDGGTALDNAGAGTTFSATGMTDTVVLTLVGAFAPEIADGAFTGSDIAADTSIPNGGGLGVNNPSIGNTAFDNFSGSDNQGNESTNFNVGESVIIEFDTDVILDEFDFQSFEPTAGFTVSVEGGPTLNFGPGTEDFDDPFSGLVITAGTDITFLAFGTDTPDSTPTADDGVITDIRIAEIHVNTDVPVVPEPSSLALLGLLGGVAAIRRRR